jgi:DNA modification methylase
MLYKGDMFDILKTFKEKEFDLCVTDPPYNVDAKAYAQSRAKRDEKVSYDDLMDEDAYWQFSIEWFTEIMRISKSLIFSPGHTNIGMWHTIEQPTGYLFHQKNDGQGFSKVARTTKTELYLVYGKLPNLMPTNTIKANLNHHIRYGKHPHPKPRELYTKILEGIKPKRVIDPMCGSGNSAYAMAKYGADYVVCEMDSEYWEDIENAIEDGAKYQMDTLWEI